MSNPVNLVSVRATTQACLMVAYGVVGIVEDEGGGVGGEEGDGEEGDGRGKGGRGRGREGGIEERGREGRRGGGKGGEGGKE